jgi:hypothetical protein
MLWHPTLEETEVTLHDTVFWACADSVMKSGHSMFLVSCTGQYRRTARRLSVLILGKLWKDMVTILVYGGDPALPERRKSHGRSTWLSKIGSQRAILSSLHFLLAGHQGYAAAAAATATLFQ